MRQGGACRVCLEFDKGARHAGKAQLVKLVEGGMHQQCRSPNRLMVVAGAADVGVIGQQFALCRPGWRMPVETVLEDRLD